MSRIRRRRVVASLSAAVALLVAACHGRPSTPPAPVASAPACPAPAVDVRDWVATPDTLGLTYRLPPGFTERPPGDLPYRNWTYPGGAWLSIGRSPSTEHWISLRRAPSPGMHEMSECIDSVAGHEVLVQAWRMAGGGFQRAQRSDRYEVLALVPLRPGVTVFITGGGDRRFQERLLAIVRTVRITGDRRPH